MGFYNTLLLKFIIPLGDYFFGNIYLKNLLLWRKYDSYSEDELIEIQNKNLKRTLLYAIENISFYKDIVYNDSISPIENLKLFPVLTKDVLRKERENLVSGKFDVKNLQKNFSSGSSGIQSYSYSDKKNKFLLQAIQGHWYEWSDYQIGDSVLQFGISPDRKFPKNIKDLLYKTCYKNAFSLSENDYEKLYKTLKKRKIKYILGYPSAINEFAEYLIKNNRAYDLKGIISLGDKLFSHYEKNFNTCFNSPKIIDTYGCAEGLMMACRNDIPFYYIMSPHVYLEIVDDANNDVDDETIGSILVTCFTNDAQPFIRYKLGDLGIKLRRESYPENRKFNYPLLEKIIGRETDIIKTKNGKTLIVHSFTGILEYYPEIKQYQVVQNSLDSIEIRFITDKNFEFNDSILKQIKDKIDIITDSSLEIKFVAVDEIKSSPSGKPQIIISTLNH